MFFMTSKIMNIQKLHGKSADQSPPLWFTEGLAELFSSQWDALGDGLKDAVLNGYIEGLDNWERFYGTYFMYKLGQSVLEYIEDNFGEEMILQLVENFWMDDNFSNVMKITIGKDYTQFDSEYLYYLEKNIFRS